MDFWIYFAVALAALGGVALGGWSALHDRRLQIAQMHALARASQATNQRGALEGRFEERPYSFWFQRRSTRSGTRSACLELTAPVAHDVLLRATNAFERGSEALGLALTVASGDDAFDRRYSIQSAAQAPTAALFAGRECRGAIDRLFALGVDRIELLVEHQALRMHWSTEKRFLDMAPPDLREILAAATPLVHALPPLVAGDTPRSRTAHAAFLPFALGALALLGGGAVCGVVCPLYYPPLNVGDMLAPAVVPTLAGFAVYVVAAWKRLRCRVEGHEYWPAAVVLGVLGFAIGPVPIGLGLNGLLDHRPGETTTAQVLTQTRHHTSGGDVCYVHLDRPWQAGAHHTEIEAPWDICHELEPGDRLAVTVHPGLFGVPWHRKNGDIAIVGTAADAGARDNDA